MGDVESVSIAYETDFELVYMYFCHIFIKFRIYHRHSINENKARQEVESLECSAVNHVRDR